MFDIAEWALGHGVGGKGKGEGVKNKEHGDGIHY